MISIASLEILASEGIAKFFFHANIFLHVSAAFSAKNGG